ALLMIATEAHSARMTRKYGMVSPAAGHCCRIVAHARRRQARNSHAGAKPVPYSIQRIDTIRGHKPGV
ncbi:MAG: hypothetical protein OXK81_12720, partial [Chloroflexota bacterium]|nr:hypothetical protein [Chloroflexota bacterium]